MADVLNRATRQFLRSVNEPDYPPADWIHAPDLSAVVGERSIYWIITGDVVTLMDQAAKDVVDAALAAQAITADRAEKKSRFNDRDFKAFANIVRAEINILRAQHGLAARTQAQLEAAMDTEVDSI